MSKYLLRSAMAVSLAAVTLAFALPARAEETAEKPEKAKKRQYTGTIESIDATTSAITLKKKDGETKTFTCAADCKMNTADKKEAAIGDFKVGDKITSWYTEEGGKNVCHKMGPPKAKKDKEGTEAPAK